jgi:putative ABC transport system permease protein
MRVWLKIAARNLLRNRRRSFFTVVAVGLGLAAVNIFGGFTEYIFVSLEDGHIYARGNGHLMVFKEGFLSRGKLNPSGYLLTEKEVRAIREVLQSFREVRVVTPQLYISGLISNGKVSTIFVAAGRVPSDLRAIKEYGKGSIAKRDFFVGKRLEDSIPHGVGLSSGLARQLELGLDSDAILMAPTIHGQVNALDVQVFQVFDAAMEFLNDVFVSVPIELAESLYDTSSVDRLAVLLEESGDAEPVKAALAKALSQRNLKVEIKTWKELDPLYARAKDMLDVIFLFLFVIVFVIVVMSSINTMSMAIMERTKEIGTLRALGVKPRGIVILFALESAMLGALGSLLGIIVTLMGWAIVNVVLKPTWVPPIITVRIPLEVYLVPKYILWSTIFLVCLSVLAAVLPARRAANQAIIDALGHV